MGATSCSHTRYKPPGKLEHGGPTAPRGGGWAPALRTQRSSRNPGSLPDGDCLALEAGPLLPMSVECSPHHSQTEADCCLSSCSRGPADPGPLPRSEVPAGLGALELEALNWSTEDGPAPVLW